MKRPIASLCIGLLVCWMVLFFVACPIYVPVESVRERSQSETFTDGVSDTKPDGKVNDTKPDGGSSEVVVESIPEISEDKDPSQFTLGKMGGTVCRFRVCVKTSVGTVPKENSVLFIKKASKAPSGSIVPPMDIGPDSWFPTGKVQIVFDFSGVTLPAGVSKSDLQVAFAQNNKWFFVPTKVDAGANTATGETTHFSVWGLVVKASSCGTDADCHDSEFCLRGKCQKKSCRSSADCGVKQVCQAGLCEANVCIPKLEICNGLDDDCDGQTDEGCPSCKEGETQPCGKSPGVGVCRAGQQSCVRGAWSVCRGGVNPSTEVCNGLDDDCDGELDEGCKRCSTGQDCQRGESCLTRTCMRVCPTGQTSCGATCQDLTSSTQHCGGCQNACARGETCQRGICTP